MTIQHVEDFLENTLKPEFSKPLIQKSFTISSSNSCVTKEICTPMHTENLRETFEEELIFYLHLSFLFLINVIDK